jgi:release factor glutamine methyltransferase
MAPGEPTVAAALRDGAGRLRAAGVAAPMLECRILLERAAGIDRVAQLAAPSRSLDPGELALFERLLERRLKREPIAHILGEREFFDIMFEVSADVLVPRPETELLVEHGLSIARRHGQGPLRILDLGVGSGCILLSLLRHLPQATGVGTDSSLAALALATRNADRLRLAHRSSFVATNWAAGIRGRFDLIVSNPPYIPRAEIETLDPEVRLYEPRAALDGGIDGLAAYRDLDRDLRARLATAGTVLLELGIGQGPELTGWFASRGWSARLHRDLAGQYRALELGRGEGSPSTR